MILLKKDNFYIHFIRLKFW